LFTCLAIFLSIFKIKISFQNGNIQNKIFKIQKPSKTRNTLTFKNLIVDIYFTKKL